VKYSFLRFRSVLSVLEFSGEEMHAVSARSAGEPSDYSPTN